MTTDSCASRLSARDYNVVFLGLGSNLGDKEGNIREAIDRIAEKIGTVEAQSSLYYSEPWGFDSTNTFVNAVIRVATKLSPHQLLRATQRIERQMGKTAAHATQRNIPGQAVPCTCPCSDSEETVAIYHDRPIDIDILLYGDLNISTPDLTIPHPLMQQRPFVMVPLQEII